MSEPKKKATKKEVALTDEKSKYEVALIEGDLSKLSSEERVSYYNAVCSSVGLNMLTKPFEYINLNGALKLYARKDATDQLRQIHGVSVRILDKQQVGDLYIVTVEATDNKGRVDTSMGAVSLKGLGGEILANTLMKAETKAKRRVTLSLCGLGMLDETEVEDIPRGNSPKKESTAVKIVDKFKEKAQELGLPAQSLRDFAKANGIKGSGADKKMQSFLDDEDLFKKEIANFYEEVEDVEVEGDVGED